VITGGPTVVRVTGQPGSGRDAVLDRAVREIGTRARASVVVCPSEEQSLYAASNVRAALVTDPQDRSSPTVVVVSAAAPATGPDPRALEASGVRVREVSVGRLSYAHLGELAESVLAGPVSPTLLQHLETVCEGRAGDAVKLLRGWSAGGSIVWTSAGLEVVASDSGWEEGHSFGRVLRDLQRQMSYTQVELMQVVALLNRPVTAAELIRLYHDDQDPSSLGLDDLEALLDQLTDAGALRAGHRGYEFRHPRLRDATTAWTRPSGRRRLYQRLVESGLVPAGDTETT
jgi:hypothetical protein